MITRGDGFAASDNGEEKGRKMGMFRKIAGLACAMALLLALFALPAARTALAGENDAAKIGNKTYYRPEDVERIIRIVEDRRKDAKWRGRTI